MSTLCTFSNSFFQKRNGLPDGRVVSMTKNEYFFWSMFSKMLLKFLKVNVRPMIRSNSLKFLPVWNFHDQERFRVWNFHDEVSCRIWNFYDEERCSLSSGMYGCVMNIKELFRFLPLINISVNIG